MPRGEIAGSTDYRHQTLEDIVSDLKEWEKSLNNSIVSINKDIEGLEKRGYWEMVDYDFKATVYYSLKFYQTSAKEIKDMLDEFKEEIKQHHVDRLRNLGKVSIELNREWGVVWHQRYEEKEYGQEDFRIVERVYATSRDTVVDMIDLNNVASRMPDFIGKTLNESSRYRAKRLDWLTINPNLYGVGIDVKKIKPPWRWFK